MKSIVNTWGKASHDRRVTTETTANTLREAMTACLDLLVQAQDTIGISKICACGGFKKGSNGYSVELRWCDKKGRWWARQRRLTLTAKHGCGYVYARGDVLMPSMRMSTDQLLDYLAEGLATEYIR